MILAVLLVLVCCFVLQGLVYLLVFLVTSSDVILLGLEAFRFVDKFSVFLLLLVDSYCSQVERNSSVGVQCFNSSSFEKSIPLCRMVP